MIVTVVDPHGLRVPGSREAAFAIELSGAAVGQQNVLVETLVFRHESAQDFRSDSLTLMIRMIRQMGVIDDEKSIREGVT